MICIFNSFARTDFCLFKRSASNSLMETLQTPLFLSSVSDSCICSTSFNSWLFVDGQCKFTPIQRMLALYFLIIQLNSLLPVFGSLRLQFFAKCFALCFFVSIWRQFVSLFVALRFFALHLLCFN